jgi:PleD family two-component response regulator
MANGNGNAPVRVLIVDDFEPFRSATRSILSKRANLRIVGKPQTGWKLFGKPRS